MPVVHEHDVPTVSRLHRSHHRVQRRLGIEHDALEISRHLASRKIPQITTVASRRTLAVPPREFGERSLQRVRRVLVRRQHLRVILTLSLPRVPRPAQYVRRVRDIVSRVHDLQFALRQRRARAAARERDARERGAADPSPSAARHPSPSSLARAVLGSPSRHRDRRVDRRVAFVAFDRVARVASRARRAVGRRRDAKRRIDT